MPKLKKGDLVRLKGDWQPEDEYYKPMLVVSTFIRNKREGRWVVCLRCLQGSETVSYNAYMLEKVGEIDDPSQ